MVYVWGKVAYEFVEMENVPSRDNAKYYQPLWLAPCESIQGRFRKRMNTEE